MQKIHWGISPLAMIAVSLAQPAYAQDDPAEDVAAAAETTEGLGDIIVTANRREQSVQSSSLAIEVLGG